MSYLLFLDDVRTVDMVPQLPQNADWTIVRSYQQFVDTITQRGLPKFISFDHDLADAHYPQSPTDMRMDKKIDYSKFKEKTGMCCAKWLVEYCLDNNQKIPLYFVHSANPAGAENIRQLLFRFKQYQESQNENAEI